MRNFTRESHTGVIISRIIKGIVGAFRNSVNRKEMVALLRGIGSGTGNQRKEIINNVPKHGANIN